jgi:hypothetical protein
MSVRSPAGSGSSRCTSAAAPTARSWSRPSTSRAAWPTSPRPCSASAARPSSRSTPRRARGSTCSPPGCRCARRSGSPTGAPRSCAVAEALLYGLRLPLAPIPAGGQASARWDAFLTQGFALYGALETLELFRPDATHGHHLRAPAGDGALRLGRVCESYPDAAFSVLLGHLPPPKRTPWGLQQRIAALKLRTVVDDDGGLWHRTVEELDACAAAYTAYALAAGRACWVGDPREGVIVLPADALADRYDPLPAPARSRLSASPRPPSST